MAVTVTVPLFVPEVGETVSQEAEPLLTVQLVLEETVKVFCSPENKKLNEDDDKVNSFSPCVMLMSRDIPPPLTVMVASRLVSDELLVDVTVIVPLFEPEEEESVNQVAPFRVMLQLMLEVMVNAFCSPE